jgi:hypothetical protein
MQTILIQLDTDPLPSTFDRVVAVDAGAEHVFSYGGVTVENVTPLVHGAMFTRGPADLRHTAVFVGGSDVAAGEALAAKVRSLFFGPIRVSVLCDSNGSNTTAAAAVLAAARHVPLAGADATVLGGTGPVGQRAALLLALQGATVRVASRSLHRAMSTCDAIAKRVPGARLTACESGLESCRGAAVVIAAGAPGIELLSEAEWSGLADLRVAIDLNAVPPLGLGGIGTTDKGVVRGSVACYGAIGVGGTKMKIHKAAVRELFAANDRFLEAEAIFRLGQSLPG